MTDFDAKARTWDLDPAKAARARRVAELIAAAVPDLARRRVLEYGAGTGLLGFALLPRVAHLTMADTSREMLAVTREKIAASGAANAAAVQLDLTEGPLPDERYDLLCMLLTLHHVRDTERFLGRARALLASGGLLCISDLDSEDGSFHGPGVDVHHGFDRAHLAAQLERAGFARVRFEEGFEIAKETAAGPRPFRAFVAFAEAA